ncbi:MAG TPA: TnsA endonuclease N-terminal domain-containing protein [Solirubrobacteraceae bacterium]|nr:TnsA endonuclease N-terminal domain-containing protein [Solirubrobacteraceae bacterium]
MSTVETKNSIESSTLHGTESAPVRPQPSAVGAMSARVYEELGWLVEFMPERDREVFCFRWGLRGQFPHIPRQVERKFQLPRTTVEAMLTRCLWNVARHAHLHELPALREVLGGDRERWAERAWALAVRRWGDPDPAFPEAVLLLSAAGLGVLEAHQVARQHMVDIGLGRGNRWGRPLSDEEQADACRQAVDRMLAQVIWPSTVANLPGLDGFSVRRPLAAWGPEKSGVFPSGKLERLVGFDSQLELVILRALDRDARVVDYLEQPVTIPYVLEGEAHEYTPDVIVRLDDGRAFIIEAKPSDGLGDFTNWMKWASLARWCECAGLGFWIGSPQRSIIDHRGLPPDPELRELVTEEVQAGAVTAGEYTALRSLVGPQHLGLIATAELLQWRPDRGRIQHADGPDRQEAQQLWAVIDQHPHARRPDSPLEGSDIPWCA